MLRGNLCFILEKDYLEIEFFSPRVFEQILQTCSKRYTNHSSIRCFFGSKFNYNGLIENEIIDKKINEIEFKTEFYENVQPTFINLKVSNDKKCTIEEFFLKVGISLNWDNQIFFDTIFLPIPFEAMLSRFKTNKSKILMQAFKENTDEFKHIYLVTEEDNLSFLIEAKDSFIYIEEVFWWS